MGVRSLDDHISSRIHIHARGVARVRLHQPDDDRDVIGRSLEDHRDRPVDLQEIHRSAVVVSKRRRFWLERGELRDNGDQVLADQPFGVLRVRESRRTPL